MGKQGQPAPGFGPGADHETNQFWIAERASAEFERIIQSTADVYFSTLKNLAESQAMTPSMQEAMRTRENAGYLSSGVTLGGTVLGGVFGSYLGVGPLVGGAIGGALSGAASSFVTGQMSYQASLEDLRGQGEGLSALAAQRSGRGAAWGQDLLNSSYYNITRPAIANDLFSLYNSVAGAPTSYATMGTVEAFYRGTMTPGMPEGSPAMAQLQMAANMGMQALHPGSYGMDPASFRNSITAQGTATNAQNHPTDILTKEEFVRRLDQGGEQDWLGRQLEKLGIKTPATRSGQEDQYRQYLKMVGAGKTGQIDEAALLGNIEIAGGEALQMAKDSGLTMSREEEDRARQKVRGMAIESANIAKFGSEAGLAALRGDATGASGAASAQASALRARADRKGSQVQYNADGSVKAGSEMIAEQAASAAAEAAQASISAAQYTYSGAAIGVATGRAQSELSFAEAQLYGSSGDISRGFAQQLGALQSERGAVSAYQRVAPLGEQAELQARLINLMKEEEQVRVMGVRALTEFNSTLAQSSVSAAVSQQQAVYTQGVGGLSGLGYATSSSDAAQRSAESARQNALTVYNQVKASGRDPMRSQAYMDAANTYFSRQATAESASAAEADSPLSLGLRREERNASYAASVLENVPGTYGNVRGALQRQFQVYEQQAAEISAERDALVKRQGGSLTEPQANQFEMRLQEVGMKQAGVFKELLVGWEGRLIGETLNGPSNMGGISPVASMRAAVGAGVVNPGMGSNQNNMPAFMRMAGEFSTIGATGMPSEFTNTALAGGRGMGTPLGAGGSGHGNLVLADGTWTITIRYPDGKGGWTQDRGTLAHKSSERAGSPDGQSFRQNRPRPGQQ